MAVSLIGIPSFYHHCLLNGVHNWQTGFVSDAHNHCVCCEDIEDECSHAESSSSCCENVYHQNETAVTHTDCCSIEMVSLQIIATEYFPKHQLKQLFNFVLHFEIPCLCISNEVFPKLNFSSPLPYLDFSPPRAAIFLFTQFLL
jgi:hypothetical protein